MNEEEEILKQTIIEEEKTTSAISEKVKEKKIIKKKKRNKRIIIFAVLAFFAYVFWWATKPFKASAEYGICRSFLELFVPYPHTIYVSEIKPARDGALRLWYTHIDAFGEYRMEEFQCKLVNNPETGALELSEIKIHKVYLEPEKLKYLNHALVYFAENPLILNWPAPLPDSLDDLHFDFNSVRKFVINIKK